MNFVFLHVGTDPNVQLFVDSIRLTNPKANIIQCSDKDSPEIDGVSEVFRMNSNPSNLMTFRLECFSKLGLQDPAIYMDSDMLVLKIIPENILNGFQVICCKRTFGCNDVINTSFRGMDLKEYSNKTFGEIYPILACFTITKDFKFWSECFNELLKLDQKFHWWYGDQEAMRNIANSAKFKIDYLPESEIACLPEYAVENIPPLCLHFKGQNRKVWMRQVWEFIQNQKTFK